jgi:hypothetical protein
MEAFSALNLDTLEDEGGPSCRDKRCTPAAVQQNCDGTTEIGRQVEADSATEREKSGSSEGGIFDVELAKETSPSMMSFLDSVPPFTEAGLGSGPEQEDARKQAVEEILLDFSAGGSDTIDEGACRTPLELSNANHSERLPTSNRFDLELLFPSALDIESYCSTNASDGIRPYCPNRQTQVGEAIRPFNDSTLSASRNAPDIPTRGASPAVRRWGFLKDALLWMKLSQLLRACRSFIPFGLVLGPLYANGILIAFELAPLRMCGGGCKCSVRETIAFAFTYFFATSIPRAVLSAVLLHSLLPAESRTLNGSQSPLQDEGQGQRATRDGSHVLRTPLIFAWDLPSVATVLRKPAVVLTIVIFLALEAFVVLVVGSHVEKFVEDAAHVAAFAVPLGVHAFYRGKLAAFVPIAVVLCMPFVFQIFAASANRNYYVSNAFVIGWPTMIMLADRFFYYLVHIGIASLANFEFQVPVAAKVCLSVLINSFSLVLVVCVAVSVDAELSPATVVAVALQVFIYEMLFGTLLLERCGYLLCEKLHQLCGAGEYVTPLIGPCDFRCIGTQTRWCSTTIGLIAVMPLIAGRLQPIKVNSATCEGKGHYTLHWKSFGLLLAALVLAGLLTAYIRWRNCCLRPPILIRSKGISFFLCAYLLLLVPYGVPFVALKEKSILPENQ